MAICTVLRISRIAKTAIEITDKYLVFVGKKIFLQSLLLCTSDVIASEPGQCSTINSNAYTTHIHLSDGMNHLF